MVDGELPAPKPGVIPGHEIVGRVVETGPGVAGFASGDRVGVPWLGHVCGTCRFCREGHYGQCTNGGGWALGHTIDGVQAEYARVPFGDLSLYPIPLGVSYEAALRASPGVEMPVAVAVVRETAAGERRVAATPEIAKKIKARGADVVIERGAGQTAYFPDAG